MDKRILPLKGFPVARPTCMLSIAGLSTTLLGSANADIESSALVGYHSDYIYRGVNLGEDLVDFSLGFAGNTDLADWNIGLWSGSWAGNVDEFRAEASVSRCVSDALTVSAGLANRSHEGGGLLVADQLEPFLGASTNLGGIALSTSIYFNGSDDSYTHDFYYEVGASYSADLGGSLSGSLIANAGVWDTEPLGRVAADVMFYSVTDALEYAASDAITLSAYLSHSVSDDWVLEDETFGGASDSVSL